MFFLFSILFSIISSILLIIAYLGIPVFLIFLVLKLCSVINWSWWIVCIPLISFIVSLSISICIKINSHDD